MIHLRNIGIRGFFRIKNLLNSRLFLRLVIDNCADHSTLSEFYVCLPLHFLIENNKDKQIITKMQLGYNYIVSILLPWNLGFSKLNILGPAYIMQIKVTSLY